jgi:hypothetical protein
VSELYACNDDILVPVAIKISNSDVARPECQSDTLLRLELAVSSPEQD